MKKVSKELQEMLLGNGILQKWHTKEWEDFTNDNRAKRIVLNYLKEYKEALKDGVGIYMWGDNGVGKTLLLNLLMMDLLLEKRCTVRIISMSTLITKFTGGWYDGDERRTLTSMLQSAQFLGIEEIGKEHTSELATTVLDNVLRYRVQMNRPVIFTSNKAASDITTTYSEDIASMMRECCIDLNVKGKDKRIEIAEGIKSKWKDI